MVKVIKPFCWDQNFDPKALFAHAPGLYTHEKSLKNVNKIRVQRDFFKTCSKWSKNKAFLLTLKFWPQLRAIYMWKNVKKHVEMVLKLATNGQSDKGFLLTSTFVPKGLSAPAMGLYTCIKALKYIPGPGVRWAFTGPLVLWFLLCTCLKYLCNGYPWVIGTRVPGYKISTIPALLLAIAEISRP